jgi:hypothetical protein
VNVTSAGTYAVQVRVAAPSGGSLHVGFNGASNSWQAVSIPATGGWQTWTTVAVTVTLSVGTQQMTLLSDTGGFNVESIQINAGAGGANGSSGLGSSSSASPIDLPVLDYNIQIDDSSVAHAHASMDQAIAVGPVRPQIITVEEAWLEHFDDYIHELEAQTGQTWYGSFATHCPLGDWNGTTCTATPTFPDLSDQGIGVFSTFPIVSSSVIYFPFPDCYTSARVGLRTALNVNGTIVQVFALHLQTGGCENDMQSRDNSMAMFKNMGERVFGPTNRRW